MRKVIVTGGAGFIGSHLVERLLADGDQVLVIDNLSVGRLDNLPGHKNLTYILDDINNLSIKPYFENVDVVFHLAAMTRPQESIEHPDQFNDVNIQGTLRILEHCRDHKVKRLVFASSSSAYGDQGSNAIAENNPLLPMSPYALTKWIGEQYCVLFHRMYRLEFNAIRPFNVYGPRQDPNGGYAAAIPKFIKTLLDGETPYITGDGDQARDFIYIEDVVDIMIKASVSEDYNQAFNAGSGERTSINELYQTIAGLMKSDVQATYVPPVFEPKYTLSDNNKVRNMLNFRPKYNLITGLMKTIEGYKNENSN